MPRTANSKTKDELLVENAILKYNEQVRTMLKEELAPFSASIKELNKRMDLVETDVVELKDVMQPFAAIRRKLWFLIIAASITLTIVGGELMNWLRSLIK